MIVFNLSCSQHHQFDGWFRSADEFARQAAKQMVACPICGDQQIVKQLSAPRLNMGAVNESAGAESISSPAEDEPVDAPVQEVATAAMAPDLQAHMLKEFKQFVINNTENVGGNFAETARKMHYGEEAHRNIRGRVSTEESAALREEGIDTLGLPPGIFLDEGVQ